jgi:hypothetical protein
MSAPDVPNADRAESERALAPGLVRRTLQRLEVDSAVSNALLLRAWQFLSGPVSMVVILTFYSEIEQGLFYTFASLVLWHGVAELGLQTVISTMASHEWAHLKLGAAGTIEGSATERRRLAALAHTSGRWYAGVALGFAVIIGGIGYGVLSLQDSAGTPWRAAWLAVIAWTTPSIWLSSRVAVLEGCGQLGRINAVRLWQAVTGSLAVWVAIAGGGGLWAAAVSAAVRAVWDLWLVRGVYGAFFLSLRGVPDADLADSRAEIWPLQWRMGVRTLLAHLGMPLVLPVIYAYHGSVAAGRLGMTLTILQAIEAAAWAWMQSNAPQLGMSVARRDFSELDRRFRKVVAISTLFEAAGGFALVAVVAILSRLDWTIAEKISTRLADAWPTLLLVISLLVYHVVRCLGIYIYVHKRDPFLLPQFVASPILGLCIWWGGRNYGIEGVAAGLLIGFMLVFLPAWTWLYFVCRRDWH